MVRKPILIACFAALLTTAVVGGAAIQGADVSASAATDQVTTPGGEVVNVTFIVSNEREQGQVRDLTVRVTEAAPELNVTEQNATIDTIGANNSTRVTFPTHVPAETPDGNYTVEVAVLQGERQVANATATVQVNLETTETEASSSSDDSGSADTTGTEADGDADSPYDETKDSWWYKITSGFFDGSEDGWFEWDWPDLF